MAWLWRRNTLLRHAAVTGCVHLEWGVCLECRHTGGNSNPSVTARSQASSETLQCPRCSASVPAHPGVCGNCGENVFQCHKCR